MDKTKVSVTVFSAIEAKDQLIKAKYTKRWKGPNGKWNYSYNKPLVGDTDNWLETIKPYVQKYIEQGMKFDAAMTAGMADYTATLEEMSEGKTDRSKGARKNMQTDARKEIQTEVSDEKRGELRLVLREDRSKTREQNIADFIESKVGRIKSKKDRDKLSTKLRSSISKHGLTRVRKTTGDIQ